MIETSETLVKKFIQWAIPPDGFETGYFFEIGDFIEIEKNAPHSAVSAYKAYIKLISHTLLNWDSLIIRDRRIVGMAETATGKSKAQCEIILRLIADGWIENDPFIKSL